MLVKMTRAGKTRVVFLCQKWYNQLKWGKGKIHMKIDAEEIYREYHEKVFNYARGKMPTVEDAEDVCSEVFLKVQSRIEEYDTNKASVSTWIYAITKNCVIDFYRKNRITEEIPEELASDMEVDSNLLRKETLRELAEALLSLPEEEREVIILYYYENMSLRQIEKLSGLSYGQVKLRRTKALENLKVLLNKYV